jgi:SAM-dependent methyltransferase
MPLLRATLAPLLGFKAGGFMDPQAGETADTRQGIYLDLHGGQLSEQEASNAASAERILDIVMDYYRPSSVLDVGCGLGIWLKVARSRGVAEAKGIEGHWLDPAKLHINARDLHVLDLEKSFDLERRFDLVISLEVAEHISASAADHFIASLTRHAPVVLFSAAIPHQGGHHHVNEQFLPYWVERFARFGFRPLDVIRGKIWNDRTILWWLRQNVVLFAEQGLIARDERLRRAADESAVCPLSLVHPDVYRERVEMGMQAMAKMAQLAKLFGQGGLFRVTVGPNGITDISKT